MTFIPVTRGSGPVTAEVNNSVAAHGASVSPAPVPSTLAKSDIENIRQIVMDLVRRVHSLELKLERGR